MRDRTRPPLINRRQSPDRRQNKGRRRSDSPVPTLRCIEKSISYDTLSTLHHLADLVRAGDCIGIAYAAVLTRGNYAYGYSGAVIEQPELASGIVVNCLLADLKAESQGKW